MKAYYLLFPIATSLFACSSTPKEAQDILSGLDSLDVIELDSKSLDSLSYGLVSSDNAVSKTVQKVSSTITNLKNTISVLKEKVDKLENEVKELKNENSNLKSIISDSVRHSDKPFEFFSRKAKDSR